MSNLYHLVLSCPDKKGIVAAVSSFIAEQGGFIEDCQQYSDHGSGWFFMRYVLDLADLECSEQEFLDSFLQFAEPYNMKVSLNSADHAKRIVLMVSKTSHCLEDILYRWHCKDLHANVVAVISNHEDLKERTEWYGIPFYYIPVDKNNKAQHFIQVQDLLKSLDPELIVLARYMQILPSQFCAAYPEKIINIHHSFLPSFVGASPYRQAYEKGVKLIGATSHFVTEDLDQGPIIEQEVTRISHRNTLKDYIRLGCDVERNVLSRALKAYLEDRIIVHKQKTIVFDS